MAATVRALNFSAPRLRRVSSPARTFVTPDLTSGTDFVYTLSAKIVRDGETRTVTEKVSVRAGEETRLNLGAEKFSALTVAAK